MRRTLSVTALLVVLCAVVSTGVTAQRLPPHRIFGVVTVNGSAPPVGTSVEAYIGNILCASGQTTSGGNYVVDVDHATSKPGCGTDGKEIVFRIGGQTATPTATFRTGLFQMLDLTVSSAPPPPAGYTTAALNLVDDNRPCIPASGQTACDGTRAALWNGDYATWSDETARQGKPAPTADDVFVFTYEFRISAGDPLAIASVARGLGWPYLQVTRIRFVGSGPDQGDEYVEISNLGGASQDMTDWALRSPDRGAVFRFPAGFVMDAGRTCRVYTGAPQTDSCTGTGFGQRDVWPDDSGRVVLVYEPFELVAADTRYSAAMDGQPPPPNLQGVN